LQAAMAIDSIQLKITQRTLLVLCAKNFGSTFMKRQKKLTSPDPESATSSAHKTLSWDTTLGAKSSELDHHSQIFARLFDFIQSRHFQKARATAAQIKLLLTKSLSFIHLKWLCYPRLPLATAKINMSLRKSVMLETRALSLAPVNDIVTLGLTQCN
jgi:hypothetical protein